jgi:hypothetical protein
MGVRRVWLVGIASVGELRQSDVSAFQFKSGFVAFVDLLGFRFLTREATPAALANVDFESLGFSQRPSDEQMSSSISMNCLVRLRGLLQSVSQDYEDVQIAQLSDGAFLWSESSDSMLHAICFLFREACEEGLLVRGGLAWGIHVVPDQHDSELGKFVVGAAVTHAVEQEQKAMGSRITVSKVAYDAIIERTGERYNAWLPTNGLGEHEFQWYLVPSKEDQFGGRQVFAPRLDKSRACLTEASQIMSMLLVSRKFDWNLVNAHGRRHMVETVCSIAEAIHSVGYVATEFMSRQYVGSEIVRRIPPSKVSRRRAAIQNEIQSRISRSQLEQLRQRARQ